jgi:monoamine oxidase
MAQLDEKELIEFGLTLLADIFQLSPKQLKRDLIAARAIDWARDAFAGGAYSYATPETRKAQSRLSNPEGGVIFLSGEALYRGPDMGTVEAALASGREVAKTILSS